jgi:predicted amidohydrolase
VAKVLDSLRPRAVVSAAAAGADLLVLPEAIHRGIDVHVVLAIDAEQFLQQSVVDSGPEWVRRFADVQRHVSTQAGCSLLEGNGAPDDEWYLAAHDQLLDRAAAVAHGEVIVALTVRPPTGEMPASVTDEFASRAEHRGMLVLTIDPRPGSPETPTVS